MEDASEGKEEINQSEQSLRGRPGNGDQEEEVKNSVIS